MGEQEAGVERREIGRGHVRDEPLHRRTLLGGRLGEGALDLGAVRAGGVERRRGRGRIEGMDGRRRCGGDEDRRDDEDGSEVHRRSVRGT